MVPKTNIILEWQPATNMKLLLFNLFFLFSFFFCASFLEFSSKMAMWVSQQALRPPKKEWVVQYALVTKSNPKELQVNRLSINTFFASSCGKATLSSKMRGRIRQKWVLRQLTCQHTLTVKNNFGVLDNTRRLK